MEFIPPVTFIASSEDALADARVLQTQLAMMCSRNVLINARDGDIVADCEMSASVVLLLTANALTDPALLYSTWKAAKDRKPIVPICLAGRGYQFAFAEKFLHAVRAVASRPHETLGQCALCIPAALCHAGNIVLDVD